MKERFFKTNKIYILIVLIAFLIGIFSITVFSSITAVTQKKLAQLESDYLNKYNNNLQLSGGGFWLYQKEEDKTAIIPDWCEFVESE